jgi:aminoglycoside 6'-N-acetyltransferase
MKLRSATPIDAALLRYWDTKAHVIAARGEDSVIDWDDELARQSKFSEYVIAELDGRPVGVMQIIDAAREETHYWGNIEQGFAAIDIWIGEESDLGRGYGTLMMRLALRRCFDDPAIKAVVIDPLASNTRAHRFYERLGFRFVERRTFDDDDCFVLRLDRADWSEHRSGISPRAT